MKAVNFILHSQFILDNAKAFIDKIELNGKYKVTISNAGDRSLKQNALMWMWHTQVANSGKGSYDTKEAVHRATKQRWVIPILLRDDTNFAEVYRALKEKHGADVDLMNWFCDEMVSTSTLTTHQLAEILTDYQRFYTQHEVELTNPEDLKLLYYERDHVKD